MDVKEIGRIISKIQKEDEIYSDKSKLDPLASETTNIIGREKEAEELIRHLGHKSGHTVPLVSVYGRSGAGKSILVRFILNNMPDVTYCFANLRKAKTIFGAVNIILGELGLESVKSAQGLDFALEKIKRHIFTIAKSKLFVLVLDEFDVIFNDKRNNPSDFVYKIVEMHSELKNTKHNMCIITISNNVLTDYELDDRVKSRIGISEIFLSPYSRQDIHNILKSRAEIAFKIKIDEDIIKKCTELSFLEHGDARRAIDLLRVSAEIASTTAQKISIKHVEMASEKLQRERVIDIISSLSVHSKVACLSLAVKTYGLEQDWHSTTTLYERYQKILDPKINPLTHRRFSDILKGLEDSGIVESKKSSKGRHGYSSEFRTLVEPQMVGKTIDSEWWEENVVKYKNNQRKTTFERLKKSDPFYELQKTAEQTIKDYW